MKQDVLLILSNSGETEEIVQLLPHVKKLGAKIVAITGYKDSPLGRHSDLGLAYQLENRRYNPDFRERDSKTHQAKCSLSLPGSARSNDVDLLAGYRWDLAKGDDGDEPEAPPDADISYHGPITGVEGRLEFTRQKSLRVSGDISYLFGYRRYDSKRLSDAYHIGRRDVIQNVEVGLPLSTFHLVVPPLEA